MEVAHHFVLLLPCSPQCCSLRLQQALDDVMHTELAQ